MELINGTKMRAGYTLGLDPNGRERVVVAIKGTYRIPVSAGDPPQLADEQMPLKEADEFTGEPGFSAPLYESDYAPFKPRCDVLLVGSAHAPGGQPTKHVVVDLNVGPIQKTFEVVGNRVWDKILLSMTPSEPQPFLSMPITYDRAYGGVDIAENNPDKIRTYTANPVGVGYYPLTKRKALIGKPLPNTQGRRGRVTTTTGKYRPMSFGSIGRNFASRVPYAGTYDQNWIDNTFPFLPPDFKEAYFQAAPTDQQIDYPRGGEQVVLTNLTPQGHTSFNLPKEEMPVVFYVRDGDKHETQAVIDTLLIEPDHQRFSFTWRASMPLKKDIFEVAQIVAGRMPRAWYRAKETGKTYYPSLAALVSARWGSDEEDED